MISKHEKAYKARGAKSQQLYIAFECFDIIRGAEGRGEQRRGLRTKALMRDLGARLECQQRVFVKAWRSWPTLLAKHYCLFLCH